MDTADGLVSDISLSPPPDTARPRAPKRTASEAELHPNGVRPPKSIKRRASKACQSCRARKVRCNVAKHGVPCTNCRMDEVDCIVGESKRKKKGITEEPSTGYKNNTLQPSGDTARSGGPIYEPLRRASEHVPHALYQGAILPETPPVPSDVFYHLQQPGQQPATISEGVSLAHNLTSPAAVRPLVLPAYIKPLPARFGHDDITYLQNKGALAIPEQELRNELLRCYAEYTHPFMPLLDLPQFLRSIDHNDGVQSISLLLFQAVMFTGVAPVGMHFLKAAGYSTRREARRAFFNKARLLYDFDYEADRITLIQALLLMTYWTETPKDQKESHHWIEIALSLSHKIGLHRNSEPAVEPSRQRLNKRIWWSMYMRDSQIALGTRRPTRIQDVDFEVPMLQLADFQLEPLPDSLYCLPADCKAVRDTELQRKLAIMCIEKAKLCMCLSHILSVQRGVTSSKGSTRTASMLFAKPLEPRVDQIQASAKALRKWKDRLPEEAQYVTPTRHDVDSGSSNLVLHRSFLHMVYYATLWSLHRPQLLPQTEMPSRETQSTVVDVSRRAVRLAAAEITAIANGLHNLDLVRYLPSPGITVLLPAIVIHLLDVLAPERSIRGSSLQNFCRCMQIMAALREIYAAADYSTAFLEAAIQRTEMNTMALPTNEDRENLDIIASAQGIMGTETRLHAADLDPEPPRMAPPPEDRVMDIMAHQNVDQLSASGGPVSDDDTLRRLDSYLVSTVPASEQQLNHGQHGNRTSPYGQNSVFDAGDAANGTSPMNVIHSDGGTMNHHVDDFELDFNSTSNLDAASRIFDDEAGAFGTMHGDSGEFALDMDWMKGMSTEGMMAVGEEGGSSRF